MRIWPFHKPKRGWQHAEEIAAKHLKRAGYKVLHRNLRLDHYEIDIIAQRKDTVVFVEVRSREKDTVASPEETIGYTKRRRLRAAARRYMARYGGPDVNYRFDVMGIIMSPGRKPVINHIEFAFTMDE